jgi:hypothetical protein
MVEKSSLILFLFKSAFSQIFQNFPQIFILFFASAFKVETLCFIVVMPIPAQKVLHFGSLSLPGSVSDPDPFPDPDPH